MTIPKLTAFEITAVIPTGSYANIQPKLVIEATDFDSAYSLAMPLLERISSDYGESGNRLTPKVVPVVKPVVAADSSKILTCWATGQKIRFSHGPHSYIDQEGHSYLSGSQYAKPYSHPFKRDEALKYSAQAYNVSVEEVADLWQSKSDAATTLGTALHQALETYGKWHTLNAKIGKEMGIHPILLPIVEKFYTPERLQETAIYEAFVMQKDDKNQIYRCGQLDRVVVTGPKHCIIEDYKTNVDLDKHSPSTPKWLKPPYKALPNTPTGKYTLQLNFYRAILEAAGWTVEGLQLHWWNWDAQQWETIILPTVPIL